MASSEECGTGSIGQSCGAQGLTTLQVNATAAAGFNTPPQAASPASSRGSWVVDPEDGGWDGVGISPPHSPTPDQRQHSLSPVASPLRSWAQVPQSPPAAQYPTSPPRSPGSVRSSCSGSCSAAGEGLVGLARDEISDEMEVCEAPFAYPSAPVACPSVPSPSRAPSEQKEAVGCSEIGDVDMVDVKLSDGAEFPVVVAAGLTPAEAAEAIAEAGELGAAVETMLDPPSRVVASPSRTSTGALAAEPSLPVRSATVAAPAGTPPKIASPPRTRASVSVTTNTSAVPGAGPSPESSVRTAACIPIDPDVDAIGSMGGADVDDKYDGKYSDRLWRWTGLITAAKMGVIPMIVLGTVAALSTQNSGGGDRGGRTSGGAGGGVGGGGGGGGGGTRCSNRRPRPRGGGGGNGCFPGMRGDRNSYGCVPMPFCVAPSVVCA